MKSNNFTKSEMHIRKPVSEVFEAFINPKITTKFWFSKSSGVLIEDATVEWTWEKYNVSAPVFVRSIISNKRILIEWGSGAHASKVEWTFEEVQPGITYMRILNSGLQGSDDDLFDQIRDSTGGFTMVLAGLKAFLEHGIRLGLVEDKVMM